MGNVPSCTVGILPTFLFYVSDKRCGQDAHSTEDSLCPQWSLWLINEWSSRERNNTGDAGATLRMMRFNTVCA